MAFNSTIPQATDQESQSQAQLLANFAETSAFLIVNHVPFNGVDQGKHNFIHFPKIVVGGVIPPAVTANEIGLYNADNAGGNSALWIRKTNVAGTVTGDVDITSRTYNVGTRIGTYTLPCGVIVKFGWATCAGANYFDVVFATAFPTAIMNIQVSPTRNAHEHGSLFIDNGTITVAGFRAHFNNGYHFYWRAEGY